MAICIKFLKILKHRQSLNIGSTLSYASSNKIRMLGEQLQRGLSDKSTTSNISKTSLPKMVDASAPADLNTLVVKLEQADKLTKDFANLSEEKALLHERYQRVKIEKENVYLDLQKREKSARTKSMEAFVQDMLNNYDEVENCLKTLTLKETCQNDAELKQLYDALVLAKSLMSQIFEQHQLEPFNPIGQMYEPRLHEIVAHVKNSAEQPQTVVEVMKQGFIFEGICIRRAHVAIAVPCP